VSQQLNLLPKDTDGISPAKLALIVLGLVVAAVLVTWGIKRGMLVSARADEAASAAQLHQVSTQLQERVRTRSAELKAEVEALRSRAEAAKQVLNLAAATGRAEGYAPIFSLLTTIKEDGLWLTDVAVTNAGKSLLLQGNSLDKAAVIRYSARLNKALETIGTELTTLELSPQTSGGIVGASAGEKSGGLATVKFTLR
jgi:hypothetical protein